MYMDKILGTKTKINILSVLVAQPERSIIENELAKEAGMSVSEVNRQIKDLVNAGLVTMERTGKAKVYRVNRQHFLYQPLRSIFRSLKIYTERLRTKLLSSWLGSIKWRLWCSLAVWRRGKYVQIL
jgi:DNA-binding transcriptional ArsR family regulator